MGSVQYSQYLQLQRQAVSHLRNMADRRMKREIEVIKQEKRDAEVLKDYVLKTLSAAAPLERVVGQVSIPSGLRTVSEPAEHRIAAYSENLKSAIAEAVSDTTVHSEVNPRLEISVESKQASLDGGDLSVNFCAMCNVQGRVLYSGSGQSVHLCCYCTATYV
ncbi:hypothetical protein AB833_26625 [Chromatiales bacterium (ex Bugula neritina AB1)]|nr:hypothetical protein AB833_26625 [Chromatiales bacterium (ex Bugula neritina AB1)]